MNAVTPLAAFARPKPLRWGRSLPHWRPGLGAAALHGEIFAPAAEASGAALALAFALDAAMPGEERSWLWVQDAAALRRGGRPYRPGLPPALRHRLIHVAAKTPEDALFALEEGLRCRDLAFVVGEIAGNPKALGFTAARRLSLAVERHGTPLWLVRLGAGRDLSSARQRWEAKAASSLPPRWNAAAPGAPAWQAELFRARAHPPGAWVLGLRNPLPDRGEDTQAWQLACLAGVGEGHSALPAPRAPLQAALAADAASCAILSPSGERASA
jgi:protein ImuA